MPRVLPDPEPVVWSAVVLTILFAGVVGGGTAWAIARKWAR